MDTQIARGARMTAARLPQGNVISVLYEQHARIRGQFDAVSRLHGELRTAAFGVLREMIAAHEAAEEIVLRPVASLLLPAGVSRARQDEEGDLARGLAAMERLDVEDHEFARSLYLLEEAFSMHASREEAEEYPAILGAVSEHEQAEMGRWIVRATRPVPDHPVPLLAESRSGEGRPVGPFTALAGRARNRLTEAKSGY